MVAPAPVWLSVDDVRGWLRVPATDHADDDLITACAAAVEPQVERARYDMRVPVDPATDPPTYTYSPDPSVYQAAVMLAGRLVRRRNSPGGVETFADSLAYVARHDPDIARALFLGNSTYPSVG